MANVTERIQSETLGPLLQVSPSDGHWMIGFGGWFWMVVVEVFFSKDVAHVFYMWP